MVERIGREEKERVKAKAKERATARRAFSASIPGKMPGKAPGWPFPLALDKATGRGFDEKFVRGRIGLGDCHT